jgi:hypothetical protein
LCCPTVGRPLYRNILNKIGVYDRCKILCNTRFCDYTTINVIVATITLLKAHCFESKYNIRLSESEIYCDTTVICAI